jgi:hypothetical protein
MGEKIAFKHTSLPSHCTIMNVLSSSFLQKKNSGFWCFTLLISCTSYYLQIAKHKIVENEFKICLAEHGCKSRTCMTILLVRSTARL